MYITRWVYFCISTLKEWIPTVKQVTSTLPHALIEAKCSLKLNQTFKCSHLCGVITNITTRHKVFDSIHTKWAVCYISPLYVGSNSYVELRNWKVGVEYQEWQIKSSQSRTCHIKLEWIWTFLISLKVENSCQHTDCEKFSILKGLSPFNDSTYKSNCLHLCMA